MVAALTRLDDQPGDIALQQRPNHPAEAFRPQRRLVSLAMKDQCGNSATFSQRINDLTPPTSPLVDKVPAPLPRKAKRPNQSPNNMNVPIVHHRHADVITRTPARLVNEPLHTHPSTITHGFTPHHTSNVRVWVSLIVV